jgi:methionyl-tRNA formyltransferase
MVAVQTAVAPERRFQMSLEKKRWPASAYYVLRATATGNSELDTGETLAGQFDQMRVSDNDRYPAFFKYRGEAYGLRIHRMPQ